jgi:NADH-quinone oxidoreductase subunit K
MELIFMSIGLNFAFFSLIHLKIAQVLSLFVFTVAATESALGLGLLISLYRLKQNISFKSFNTLKN